LEKLQQPSGVRNDVAFPRGCRRADRNDLRLPIGQALRELAQAVLEGDRLNRDF
jgi:hypothetical protein